LQTQQLHRAVLRGRRVYTRQPRGRAANTSCDFGPVLSVREQRPDRECRGGNMTVFVWRSTVRRGEATVRELPSGYEVRQNIGDAIARPADRRQAGQGI
jgi:hypothetical protein